MAEKKNLPYGYERKNVWDVKKDTIPTMYEFADDYKHFIATCKTERECVKFVEEEALRYGFSHFDFGKKLKAGDRVLLRNGYRNILLAVIGKQPVAEGVNMVVAHLDAPRLDLKTVPLIEDGDMALLKTHYYGGIKKYQWVNIPLALHGTVIRRDGTSVDLCIGEKAEDPVFTINDLLPHLAGKSQGEKKLLDGIEGENLRLVVGNRPIEDKDLSERIKALALKHLHDEYGIEEEDFISAEIEIVPAFGARDIGFDRSMVGAYGHDDRVCSYASYRAIRDFKGIPEKTLVVFLVDKEEIGSYGVTGIRSRFFQNALGKILRAQDPEVSEAAFREMFEKSYALSADVGAVINPMFKEVFDPVVSPRMGYGVILEKYTGSRGKAGASDASAELMGKVRKIFNDNNIVWQPGSLGKVDEGGGGTVAFYLADLGIQVVDCGVGVDGMHSPFEVISKADLYEAYEAYQAFLKDA
ncbi:aminopeptidase [Thermospira aquatica]|uniref:M18 family aminopeptidase n=1 Tax=Thermospira aquatica TaxID=2828656 RepID=A0AAX3BDL9_9SPIR|nr:aminopeptidase [Thermospira aquatica]URA10424.1 aminopeptidase [Thermospira aquatica]